MCSTWRIIDAQYIAAVSYQIPDTLGKLCLASSFHCLPGPNTMDGILYGGHASITRVAWTGGAAGPPLPVRGPCCLGWVGMAPLRPASAAACLWREASHTMKESVRDQMSRLEGQVPPHPCFSALHLDKVSKAGSGLPGEVAFSSHPCVVWVSSPSCPQQSAWWTLDTGEGDTGLGGGCMGSCI